MKFKKIMLVAFVLLAILTIGAASAADDVASDDLAVEDIDEVSVDTSQDDLAEDSGDVLASSEEETVGDGEYNITFYEDNEYDQYDEDDDETHVVDIRAPEEAEFYVIGTVEGIDDNVVDCEFDDLKGENGFYYLIPYDFDLDAGTYNITISCYDLDDNLLASQTGTLTFIGNEDDGEINVYLWDEYDERGILYLDTEDWDIVSIDVPPEYEGTIFVIVNGEKRGEWVIEYDDTYWTSHFWNLQDLGINETGNYTIEVKYNEETISEGNITVEEWQADSYRAEYIENEAAFVIYYVPGSNGTVFVKIENDDHDETVYEESFNFTSDNENLKLYVAEFDIESDEAYHIVITVREDPDFIYSRGFYKEGDDDDDGNEFEATLYDDEPMLFYWDSVLEVYCPDESTGTVTVTVMDETEEIIYTSNKDVDDADEEGKLYWTLAELNITSVGKYTLKVSNDGEEIDDLELEAFAPFQIVDNTFINSTDKGLLVRVFLPISIENATIIVSIEDKSFSFSLNDFVYVEDDNDGSKPIWFNPFGPEPDMNQKSYQISNSNLEFDFEETTYEVYVKLMIEGMDEIIDSNDVEFISRNVIGNDNVTIEIFKGEYVFDFGDDVVKIAKEDDCGGYILITVAENDWNKTIYLSEISEEEYICADEFEDLDEGDFEITVAYYDENDEMVFNVTETVSFYYSDVGDEEDDAEDGVIIYVPDGYDKEFDLDDPDDLEAPFATVSVRDDINGSIIIVVYGEESEIVFFNKTLDEIADYEDDSEYDDFTCYHIALNDLTDFTDFVEYDMFKVSFIDEDDFEIDSREYNIDLDENSLMFWEVKDDAEDGVIIYVPDGDNKEFDLDDQEDLEAPFAYVSVRNDIDGRIVIIIWDEECDEQELYSFDLDDITNTEDDEDYEGFTVYRIALNDLEDYNDFIECGGFKLAFVDVMDDEVDSRLYDIDFDDEENIVSFWESDDDDEEISGKGEEIEASFYHANILDDGAVVIISKDAIPLDADDEFTVIIPQEDDEPMEILLNLSNLIEGDYYVIRVSDLQLPEFRESYDILMILQFYSDGEEAYYAEWMDDDEPIIIYESPCIFDETSLLGDDEVITIQEIPDGVDEFTITISKEGSENITKTFKFSEIPEIDYEDVWVSFKLSDLGITEEGDYNITVKYRDDLTYSGNLNVNIVDFRTHVLDDDDDLKTFESVDGLVANFRISESVTGYVKLYVNGTQVGENIKLADLRLGVVPPDDGRQIILNDLNITESGEYTVKVELYSDADELLFDDTFDILVEVGESGVEVINGTYPYGTEATDEIIEYIIGSPLEDGQYFNIYFNGIKAGVITADGLEFNDEFTVPMFDVLLFKPGNYDVNVTFFDGETETYVTNGSFSINELAVTSDKDVYIYDIDSVMILFNADLLDDDELRAYYVYGWGPVGRYDSMVFNPYGGNQMIEDGMYEDGVVSFDVAHFVAEPDNDNYRLDVGDNLIYVVYRHGDVRYGGFINVTVVEAPEPVDPALTISVDDIREGTDAVVAITTNSTFSGDVAVQIGGANYAVPVVNGTGSLPVSGLAVGNYTAVATFEATDVFNASTKNATFKVNKEIIPDSDTAISTDSSSTSPYPTYSINLGPDATGTFTVKIGDKEYTKELKDGAATIEVTDLPAGAYDAVISYSGDAKYAPINKTVNSTVKVATTIKAAAVTTTYGTSKNIVITLTDANGKVLANKKVTVVLNGAKKELTTNDKGQVSYAIGTKLAVKKYDATFTFDGDANYVKSTGTAKVTVNKAKPKLTAKKKTFKAKKKSKKYTVTLKTNKGKAMKKAKVTLTGKFKGKKIKITKKTNSKGKATFNLKKLTKKGKFTAKIKFKGNKSYKAVTKKAKITVKK